jgi:hypothetical protein
MSLNIFLIALDDNGRAGPLIGCGDSAVAVAVNIPYTTGVLRAALNALLAIHDPYYGESGLYNSLYQSHLTVGDIILESGMAKIYLNGSVTLGGVCDSPRVDAQIRQTALQFSSVHSAAIFINNHPLEDMLSGR